MFKINIKAVNVYRWQLNYHPFFGTFLFWGNMSPQTCLHVWDVIRKWNIVASDINMELNGRSWTDHTSVTIPKIPRGDILIHEAFPKFPAVFCEVYSKEISIDARVCESRPSVIVADLHSSSYSHFPSDTFRIYSIFCCSMSNCFLTLGLFGLKYMWYYTQNVNTISDHNWI